MYRSAQNGFLASLLDSLVEHIDPLLTPPPSFSCICPLHNSLGLACLLLNILSPALISNEVSIHPNTCMPSHCSPVYCIVTNPASHIHYIPLIDIYLLETLRGRREYAKMGENATSLWMSSVLWPENTLGGSQQRIEDEETAERQHGSLIRSELERCELWADSDGSARALFDVVSGQYDMLSRGKYQLSY